MTLTFEFKVITVIWNFSCNDTPQAIIVPNMNTPYKNEIGICIMRKPYLTLNMNSKIIAVIYLFSCNIHTNGYFCAKYKHSQSNNERNLHF